MKLLQNKIFVGYKTTEQSKKIIESLQETFSNIIEEVLVASKKDKNFSYKKYLESSTYSSFNSVKTCLKNSLDYYNHLLDSNIAFDKVLKSVRSNAVIAFNKDQFVINDDEESSYIVISDASIVLSVEMNLEKLNINSIHVTRDRLVIGDLDDSRITTK
jgi:hypothetical protein